MVFYINACSPSLSFNDSKISLYQNIMLSVMTVQIFLILVLRVGSALKNHDIHSLQIHNKKTVIPVESIPNNLISHIINSQKQAFHQKKQEKNIIEIAKSKKRREESQNSESSSQNSQVSNKQHQSIQHQVISEKWFLNVSQLKLTFQQFNQKFSLVFGFGFISISLAIKNFPFFYSCILCLIQFMIIVILILQAILSKKVQDSQEMDLVQKQKKENFQKKLRIIGLTIISTMNIGLIFLSIIGLNMSYYNNIEKKCLF